MALLEMKGISKSFAGVYVNKDISLSVESGEIHALLGENGAGKTTLVNILFGIYSADEGDILWQGDKINLRSPKEAINKGIVMVQQHFSLVKKMTVLDNIILNLSGNKFIIDRKSAKEKILSLSKKYGLIVNPDTMVGELTVGEQQRVEILKALYRDVKLLILDEPTGVLTPQETSQFFDVLRNLKKEGYGIIIITHRMSEIISISDKVTILRDGRKVANLITSETDANELSKFMIGRELNNDCELYHSINSEAVLELSQISIKRKIGRHALCDLSVEVLAGEILGVAGVEGNWQKELAELITGISNQSKGTVKLCGKIIDNLSVRKRYNAGITYISDDRLNDSLIIDMNIIENLMLKEYIKKPYSRFGFTDMKNMLINAQQKIKEYQIKSSGLTGVYTPVKFLSGGNQQKLVIARELTEHVKLIVAAQPTRGLDIGATDFVRSQLIAKRKEGKAIILISADIEEILALSNRIAVMFAGKIIGIINREDATVEKLGLLMGGVKEEII